MDLRLGGLWKPHTQSQLGKRTEDTYKKELQLSFPPYVD